MNQVIPCARRIRSRGFSGGRVQTSVRQSLRQFSIVSLMAAICVFLPCRVEAAPGDLDATFGIGGLVLTDFPGNSDYGHGVVIQPDGKIVVAGNSGQYPSFHSALARYNPDGSLDQTFGNGGKVIANLDSGGDELLALALQADGKIIAAGSLIHDNYTTALLLARFNPDGSLDTTFGTNGEVVNDFGGSIKQSRAVTVQPNGMIYVAATSASGTNSDMALVRFSADGGLDQGFGTSGKAIAHFNNGYNGGSGASAVALQSDGKIVLAGSYNDDHSFNQFALARYNTDGNLDQTFGSGGKLSTSFGSGDSLGQTVAIQPDGKIVAAGYFRVAARNHDFALARYNPDGSLDPTFGNGGRVTSDLFGSSDEIAYAIQFQMDGKIIVAGQTGMYPVFDFGVARYLGNGQMDPTFGNNGKSRTSFGSNTDDIGYALALQSDGGIILAGASQANVNGATFDFALARYSGDTRHNQTANFDSDNKSDISIWNPASGNWYTINSSDGSLRPPVQWGSGAIGDLPVPGDYDGDGKTDIAVFRPTEGNWYIINSATNTVSLRNWGGTGDIPVAGDYDLDGKTDVAVYRPGEGNWYIRNSRDQSVTFKGWGAANDKPVPADYDGDGANDICVYRPAEGNWYIITSRDRFAHLVNWGASADKPVPADYDGDGRVDVAVYRPSEGNWYIRLWTGSVVVKGWGASTDVPVPADYDGDGKADIAIWRPAEGNWYIIQSATGAVKMANIQSQGMPVASAYLPQ